MKLRLYSFIVLLAAAAGCGVFPPSAPPRLAAARTAEPVTPDGVAAEEVWSRAQPYPLLPPRDRNGGTGCRQPGTVRFAYDDRFLYVLAELDDDDVVQEEERDNRHLYETGDVLELFLWPEGKAHYWEIYAAPNGRRSMLFFPGAGRKIFLTAMQEHTRLRAGARVDGTLNDWSDRDPGLDGRNRDPAGGTDPVRRSFRRFGKLARDGGALQLFRDAAGDRILRHQSAAENRLPSPRSIRQTGVSRKN